MNYAELIKKLRSGDKPSSAFVTYAMGEILPEIEILKGIPNPPKYHPEIDTHVHVMQVIDRAAALGCNDVSLFAALIHDCGKAATPQSNWPHHYNHEALGVPIAGTICHRLQVPLEYTQFIYSVVREHGNTHRFLEMKPSTRVKFLQRIWLCNLHDFTLVCKADSQGRGPENWNKEYPQAEAIMAAARKIGQIDRAEKSHEAWLQEAAKAIK